MSHDPVEIGSGPEPSSMSSFRFPATPHQADGGFSLLGLLGVVAITLAGAVGFGWLASFVSQWFYLLLVFPLAIGFGVGILGIIGVLAGKLRHPALAAMIGFLCGSASIVSLHYFDYQRFLDDRGAHNRAVQAAIQAGRLGFLDYIDHQAREGVRLEFRRKGGWNIGYTGSFIYWGVELLIVAGLAAIMLYAGASEPFCTQCNSWKNEQPLGTLNVPSHTAADLLRSGEIGRLAQFDLTLPGPLVLSCWVCPKCGADAPIEVKVQHKKEKKKNKDEEEIEELARITYPGEALRVFKALLAPPESAA